MTQLINRSGIAAGIPKTISTKLRGWWTFADLTGTTIADKLSANPLTQIAGLVANVAAGDPHRGRWNNSTGYLGCASASACELIAANRNVLLSLRMRISGFGTSAGVLASKQINGRATGIAFEIAGTSGTSALVRWNYNNTIQSSNNLSANADYHCAATLSPGTAAWRIYLNGADATASATAFPAMSPASADNFMVGGSGHSGAVNYGLQSYDATATVDVWDVQLYTEDNAAGIPSNVETVLVQWLYRHPYQPLPSELW